MDLNERPPRVRDDLIIQRITSKDGSVHYVIKDPITRSFFKVGEPEYFIIRNLDGGKSIDEIIQAFKQEFEVDIEKAEVEAFIAHMQELCFLDSDLTRQELLKKQKEADRDRPRTLLGRLVFIKLKAIDPGKLFDRMIGHVRFFFTGKFVWFASLVIILSFPIALNNGRQLVEGFIGLLNLQGIIILYLSMFVVIILHEFAHGLTCRHYGGEVREIGFLLIYFQPAFYCNVSDAWLFPERHKRLWVSFSGGFFQIFIWAVAFLVWRVTQQDLLLNKFALATLSFTGIATLFNFNPLLRYDGYYLLSDYVEIPNLRKKARNYWLALIRRLFFMGGGELKDLTPRERKICFYYGILSFFYIVFILGYFFLKVEQYLVSELGGTGFIIFAAIMVFLFRNIIADAVRGMTAFIKARVASFGKRKTLSMIIVIIVLLVLISIFARWELRVKGELEVNPVHSLLLKYNSLGYAQLIRYNADQPNTDQQRQVSVFGGDYTTTSLVPLVTIGDEVRRDQVIARLANTETSKFIDEYSARLAEAEEELMLLRLGARQEEISQARNNLHALEAQLELSSRSLARMNEMMAKNVISRQEWEDARTDSMVWAAQVEAAQNQLDLLLAGARPEEIRAKEAEIDRLKSQIAFHKKQQDFYELKSPIDGVVLIVDTGEVACEIANLDSLDARIVLSEKELADIAVGHRVKFKVRGYPSLSFFGMLSRIGEKIFLDQSGDRVFEVFCRVGNEQRILKPGMTGIASIYCGKRKVSYLIYRKFFRTIRTEFWDWFDWF
jgi:putative peptide zinc metalloprotease protein